MSTAVNIVVTPLANRAPGRFEVRLANGQLLVASSRQPWCDAACRLRVNGCDPNTPLIMKRAGSDAVARRSTIGNAANLKARLSPIAAKYGWSADAIPDRLDAKGLQELLERLSAFPNDVVDQIVAVAFPAEADASQEAEQPEPQEGETAGNEIGEEVDPLSTVTPKPGPNINYGDGLVLPWDDSPLPPLDATDNTEATETSDEDMVAPEDVVHSSPEPNEPETEETPAETIWNKAEAEIRGQQDPATGRQPKVRPTPRSTVEAILTSIRTRGLAALKEPKNIERLSRCDAAAKDEIAARIKLRQDFDGFGGARISDSERPEPVPHESSKGHGLVTVCASDVDPKRIDALWKDVSGAIRLARSEHTLIAGEPGLGKSQLGIQVAATITVGGDWPCGAGRAPLGSVIILSAEDNIETTLVPRLIAAGADRKRVTIIKATYTEDGKGERGFDLQADIVALERLIKEIGDVLLIIIDPITAYLGGGIDGRKNVQVRAALEPVGRLAERAKLAFLSVTHFNKGTAGASTKALYRVIDSVAFTAAPRAAFTVMEDPDDKDRRLFLHLKNNLGLRPEGLAFRLEQRVVGADKEGDFVASSVAWQTEPVGTTADQALNGGGKEDESSAKEADIEFLGTLLDSAPVKVEDIEAEARQAGLLKAGQPINKDKPFRDAKKALGIKSYQPKGQRGAGWFWALPKHQAPSEASGALTIVGAPDQERAPDPPKVHDLDEARRRAKAKARESAPNPPLDDLEPEPRR
jgi:AAA domain